MVEGVGGFPNVYYSSQMSQDSIEEIAEKELYGGPTPEDERRPPKDAWGMDIGAQSLEPPSGMVTEVVRDWCTQRLGEPRGSAGVGSEVSRDCRQIFQRPGDVARPGAGVGREGPGFEPRTRSCRGVGSGTSSTCCSCRPEACPEACPQTCSESRSSEGSEGSCGTFAGKIPAKHSVPRV